MTTYLSELKTFAQQIASKDDSDETADFEHLGWINDALADIVSRCGWDSYTKERKLNVPPQENVTGATLTQDSLAVSVTGAGGSLESKYANGLWKMHVEGEAQWVPELAAVAAGGLSGTLRAGDEWIQSTLSGTGTLYFTQERFDLPDDCFSIKRVQVMQSGQNLFCCTPEKFDQVRSIYPSQLGVYPQYFTSRDNKLEFWPHPGETRIKLSLTYFKGPAVFTLAQYQTPGTPEVTEVDWPDHMKELLKKAILLQASVTQEDPPVPYNIAERQLNMAVERWRGMDQERVDTAGPIDVNVPEPGQRHYPRSFSWAGELTDE
jgi:hypothetical protein